MAGALCDTTAVLLAVVLIIAAFRRLILTYAAIELYRPADPTASAPPIWVACACRNEALRLSRLISSLSSLRYRGAYRVILIDDASDDGSPELIAAAGQRWPDIFHTVALTGTQHGKANALKAGLRDVPIGTEDLLLVIDADHRLAPEALNNLANYFADSVVAAAGIEHPVDRPERSLVSAYCYLEAAVSEAVTSRGQAGLGLPTKLAGSWACRSSVFHDHYPEGWQMVDDTVFTARIVAHGGRIAYAADVTALQDVPDTIGGYLTQHVRWSAGYAESTTNSFAIRAPRHGLLQRIDALATHAGYFERPMLLALIVTAAAGWALGTRNGALITLGVLAFYILVIGVQIAAALRLWHASPRLIAISLVSLPMLAVDFMVSIRGMAAGLSGRRVAWTTEHRG
jgi:cellulose synthase/poly-beta-1,6-N-acetylglucosamine synthase-like glycosyltransferase